ncbi:MAG: proteasome subunit alpha [Acidimicrobiales bacterium]
MSMPIYVAPEQWMKEKADFARKGIARGRALAALEYADGILICAENTSATLRKISEIYDRIAFAGAGRYNEYDRLRIAGVRHADLKGYAFSREDVDAHSLANAYAQMIGDVFTHELKPMEVEIVVAEVGEAPEGDRLFHILYDGTVVDETGFTVLGGEADVIGNRLGSTYQEGLSEADALQAAVAALAGRDRQLTPDDLEVATLSRITSRRAFQRLTDTQIADLLGAASPATEGDDESATVDEGAPTGEQSATNGEQAEGSDPAS